MAFPDHPLAAVTHANPYPYYAQLVEQRPLYYDASLKLWVAAGAAVVDAVLASDLCGVRPLAEPVPAALLGSPAAAIFRHLVRMNDGAGHCPLKQAVTAALDAVEARAMPLAHATARRLARTLPAADDSDSAHAAHAAAVSDFQFRLPLLVVAQLLGIAEQNWPLLVPRVEALVGAFAPGADAHRIEAGGAAAAWLLDLLRHLLRAPAAGDGLLAALASEAGAAGCGDPALVAANAAGFLTQTYEASAGLIGNTLVALAAQPSLQRQLEADPAALGAAIQEVLRTDPPVQNTRRFVQRTGVVAGQPMRQGDAILVLLGAAGRDPAANPDPQRFDPGRRGRRIFCFGGGVHACPGARIAVAIAEAGVGCLLAAGADPGRLARTVRYRASLNGRMALFGAADAGFSNNGGGQR